MLDITLIREKPEWVKQQLAKRHDPEIIQRIDEILTLDSQRRALLTESESIQEYRNSFNKYVGYLRGNKNLKDETKAKLALVIERVIFSGRYENANRLQNVFSELRESDKYVLQNLEAAFPDIMQSEVIQSEVAVDVAFDRLIDASRGMGDRVNALNEQIREVEAKLDDHMLWLPNIPHDSVPLGESEEQNVPHEPEGIIREYAFEPKPHWDLGVELDIIDFERGVKIAGSRGYILKGWGARLQRALIAFFLDNARKNGFTELYLPYFVKEEMLFGAGQFPKFRDVVYFDPDADVYMVPTAEVAITNLYRDEILDEAQLPIYMVGHTPCFRRERTSAGRDVKGIKRVHQFEKVEMYKFVAPETSYQELESMTEAASDILRALELPFRRLELSTGDLGFGMAKTYDLEVWSPGCKEWLEVSSCSNAESFQARRANLKYRPTNGKKTQFLHTLNGSGLATPRVVIAIIETYQQADGSIEIPQALRPYLGGESVIPAQ